MIAAAASLAGASEPARVEEPAIKIQPTEGTELSSKDERAVRKTLSDYLAALQTKDYEKAGELLDRASLLAAVGPMVKTIVSDSTHEASAMIRIFGVSTRDSIAARSNGQIFGALMGYMMQSDPTASEVLSKATIQVLAARQMRGKVHVAYLVTLPPSEPGGIPYEQLTAQRLAKSGGKWRILFSLDP